MLSLATSKYCVPILNIQGNGNREKLQKEMEYRTCTVRTVGGGVEQAFKSVTRHFHSALKVELFKGLKERTHQEIS